MYTLFIFSRTLMNIHKANIYKVNGRKSQAYIFIVYTHLGELLLVYCSLVLAYLT